MLQPAPAHRPDTCPLTTTRGGNAIWGRAGVVIEPGTGRILLATGNGPFDGSRNWGDSVLEFAPDTFGCCTTGRPTDQVQLDHSDTDLGSTSPALLPAFGGRRLAVQGGKDGKLRVLDLDRLDGTTGGAGARLGGELSEVSTPGAKSSSPRRPCGAPRSRPTCSSPTIPARPPISSSTRPIRVCHGVADATPGTSPSSPAACSTCSIRAAHRGPPPPTGALVRSLPSASGHWNSPIVIGGRVIEPTGNYRSARRRARWRSATCPGADAPPARRPR